MNFGARADNAMVRSRQLFLRSRLELAAELEQNAPVEVIDEEYYLERGRLRLRFCRGGYLYSGYVDEYGRIDDVLSLRQKIHLFSLLFINLPFAFVYGPTYLFVKLTSGEAAAERYKPSALLKTVVPSENNDDDDDWKGRVLDVEKRTKALLKPVQEDVKQMQSKMDEMQTKMDELHAKVDRMQAENKQIRAESEARMQQMQAENRQMRAESEARAKITEEKLDLIVSLMKPRAYSF